MRRKAAVHSRAPCYHLSSSCVWIRGLGGAEEALGTQPQRSAEQPGAAPPGSVGTAPTMRSADWVRP